MQNRRGFTLIEIIVVIVIGGVLTGIVSLGLAGVQQATALDQSHRMLSSMIQRARTQAIQEGRSIELRLDGPNDYAAVVRNDGGTLSTLADFSFEAELGIDLSLDSGNTATICFGANGVANTRCGGVASVTGDFESNSGGIYKFLITAGGTMVER
jgi:prepilin-type N-terminal cleavage/methylation domain-containing protein